MKNKRYNLVIIEPSEIVIEGLKKIISSNPKVDIIGEFNNINKAFERFPVLNIDIIIINPVLTAYQRKAIYKDFPQSAKLVAILYNYIDKDSINNFDGVIDIYDSIEDINNKLINTLNDENKSHNSSDADELSEREKEILIAVSKGLTNKEIASQFNISIHTVISHRKNISKKTGIKSASGFGVYALLNNLI